MKPRIGGAAALAAAMLALGLALPASAAMYRCGNTFQDRPCDDAAGQQTIRPGKGAGAPAPRLAASAVPATPPAAPAAPAAPTAQPVAARPAPAALTLRPGAPAACAGLHEQAAAIDNRMRAAGNPNTVEMLNRQRRAIEGSWSEAGC